MSKPPPEHVSIFAPTVLRRFFLALLVAMLAFAVLVAAIYRQDVRHQHIMLEQESQHVLDLQQELLSFELESVQSDLLYLASEDRLVELLSGVMAARGKVERDYANFALNKAAYDQIRLLDMTGQEIVRVNYRDGVAEVVPHNKLQSKATRYYYQQALPLDAGEVLVTPFDLNVEHGRIQQPIRPVIRFITPVSDEAGKKGGFLVLNYLGGRLLAKLKQIASGFRGETMLVNAKGEYLQAQDPSHEWGWLLHHEQSFHSAYAGAWDEIRHRTAGKLRVGQNLFAFQRVSPSLRSTSNPPRSAAEAKDRDPSSLILVSRTSPSVANAHSNQLLMRLLLLYAGIMTVVAMLLYYWARSGEIRRYHEQRIEDSELRLRHLSSLLLAAQETERRNLSRELHDELGQQVTAIRLDLRSLDKGDGQAPPNPLLRRAIEETDHLLKTLHEIATRVRPSVLDDLGLEDAIESFVDEYQQRTGIKVNSQLQLDGEEISTTVGENVYRILQEALANVATHAEIDKAQVVVEACQGRLRMTVRDPGVGFEPAELTESTRLGILGMRERVELLNGQFDLQSAPGEGTEIMVVIPLHADKQ